MAKRYFITGTDTGVGKTYVTVGLLNTFKSQGLSCVAIKPIASGCQQTPDGLRNDDALCLQQAASVRLSYDIINPVALEPAIAPHIAAEQAGCLLTAQRLQTLCQPAFSCPVDVVLFEGVGGWCVPLNPQETMADFVAALDLNVILVVGIRLGCLNHALLTEQAIKASGAKLTGWIANCIELDMPALQENIDFLSVRLSASLLGVVGYQQSVTDCVDYSQLLGLYAHSK